MNASHRALVTAGVLATFMQAINISLPNAAVLHIQAALSMTDDEIGWVFTSYLAASALVMPMTRWLAARFGRRFVFQVSITIFSAALMLDTLATTPLQFVFARVIQGAASGTLAPLSMAILLDELPPPRHGHIAPVWAVTALLGIVSGPAIGGWFSEYHGWHSIFYLSLPAAGFIFLTVSLFLREKKADKHPPFDLFGLATLSAGLAGLQMLLDRGERMEWFASTEIWIEAITSALGFLLFAVHVLTRDEHFLNKALFRDRNFNLSTLMYFALGFVLLPTLALTSPMLEELFGYPADIAGYVTIPRGLALVGALLLAWRQPTRIDNRVFLLAGIALAAYGTWMMVGYSPQMDWRAVATAGVVQGAGIGILIPTLTRSAFSTLDPKFRSEGAMFFNLARLFGSTIGISIVLMYFFDNTQSMHLALAGHLNPYGAVARMIGPVSGPKLALINEMVTGQAALVAVIDQFKLLTIAMLLACPLVLFLRNPRSGNRTLLSRQ